jgi:hypothetical protein
MVIPYSPAPAGIANQIYAQAPVPKMIAKCAVDGQSVDQAIAWAASELEGAGHGNQTQSPTGSNCPRRLVQSSVLEEVGFARDSPLEEAGFELSVPPERKAFPRALDRFRRPSVTRRQA